ncbi:MAG: class I SAM-dependent methyltransferase, partial [Actinobacteria bacterium]
MTQIAPAPDDWWVPLARHLGEAYLQYAFTMGTAQEVEFIAETLGATAGERLLDVGCGPG